MSARFGRKKRRQARETIARLEAERGHHEESARVLRAQYGDLRDEMNHWGEEIIRALGPDSVFRPGITRREVSKVEEGPPQRRALPERGLVAIPLGNVSYWAAEERAALMHRFMVRVRADTDGFARRIHLIQNDRTSCAYSVSEDQFRERGFDARAECWLIEEIGRQMAHFVNERARS